MVFFSGTEKRKMLAAMLIIQHNDIHYIGFGGITFEINKIVTLYNPFTDKAFSFLKYLFK